MWVAYAQFPARKQIHRENIQFCWSLEEGNGSKNEKKILETILELLWVTQKVASF